MTNFSNQNGEFSEKASWEGLKKVVSESSGFKSWKLERSEVEALKGLNLDKLVHAYLRETLETLAY